MSNIFLEKVDLYKIKNSFFVLNNDILYSIKNNDLVKKELPIKINNLKITVSDDDKLILWGDDNLGNTLYIEESEDVWERLWLESLGKGVINSLCCKFDFIYFIHNNNSGHVVYNKQLYKWGIPQSNFSQLLEKDDSLYLLQKKNLNLLFDDNVSKDCVVDITYEILNTKVSKDLIVSDFPIYSIVVNVDGLKPLNVSSKNYALLLKGKVSLKKLGITNYSVQEAYKDYLDEIKGNINSGGMTPTNSVYNNDHDFNDSSFVTEVTQSLENSNLNCDDIVVVPQVNFKK